MRQNQKLHKPTSVAASAALTFAVSCATAAVVAFLPIDQSRMLHKDVNNPSLTATDYMQLHHARAMVVPNYMNVDVAKRAK